MSMNSEKNQDRHGPVTHPPALIGHEQWLHGSAFRAGGDRFVFDGRRLVRLLSLVKQFIDQKGLQKSAGFQKPFLLRWMLQRPMRPR